MKCITHVVLEVVLRASNDWSTSCLGVLGSCLARRWSGELGRSPHLRPWKVTEKSDMAHWSLETKLIQAKYNEKEIYCEAIEIRPNR